ncbi:2-(3-amino-3-carboxypropyl)histidine synthase [Candidatus Woesearchaeota archaeon]|nr:2-(3-amino-3-carboxypropyl)histidine synthase [Candidatus Woesearchaeota archaeon]
MKTLFIEGKANKKIDLKDEFIEKLPNKVALFTTVQFIDSVPIIIKKIEYKGKKVIKIKPKHCQYECQLLGCSIEKFSNEFNAFFYIGDGMFHPKALMLKNDKPVFVYNPFSENFSKLDTKDVDVMRKKQKGALLKFHSSSEIGILISTKTGQYNPRDAEKLEKKYPEKNFYKLVSDTIDFNSLEDFPFIKCFVNTACPRIAYDDSIKLPNPVVDVEDLI